ncbi:transhypothetical protein [Limosa lapponica baueri]|uniref:Transmembrane protein 201 n=1 Tax=Limosa lapponica baueri TaxID=1758121 RepID=A0A2I0TMS7_LIMLA|nr:transhypothetical protein [Limosa lapponica baueri]
MMRFAVFSPLLRCGGTVGAIFTCPLEVIKTRLQSSKLAFRAVYYPQVQLGTISGEGMVRPTSVSPGLFSVLKSILEKEGPRSLFRGLGPNLVGVAPSRAVYFACYSKAKERFNGIFVPNSNIVHICSAGSAAFITNSLMNPIWMVKTRMQLERKVRGSKPMNALQCARYVYQTEGIRGFYRGLTASYAGISETIICFAIYESLKKHLKEVQLPPSPNGTERNSTNFFGLMFAAAVSKGCASCIAYPHESQFHGRKKPTHVTVNCWFCNQDTVVPYGNRNCWDCPNCEQYNGFQENGDYNKPIPAQYMEHLNHVVSGATTFCDPTKPQQWVSSQILLCKKCNNHQTMKIKQLASFSPREEGKYDEEIEVYKHHLEQTYKLCRPCQAAVEYYIKHQNRQLRALLLSHHFKRRETDKTYTQNLCSSSSSASITTPAQVILLRFLAFISCAFLVLMALYGSGDPFSLSAAVPAPVSSGPASVRNRTATSSRADLENDTSVTVAGWQELLRLLPEQMVENLSAAWAYGKNHQMAVAVLGLFTCLLAMFLAGRIRLRRIDAFASVLWFIVMSLHLAERYLKMETPNWLDTAKFGTTSLCCLVGFTAAVATRKSTGHRRYRPRRYLSGDSITLFPSGTGTGFPSSATSLFVPTPPSILQLTNQQLFRSPRRTSSSSLPGRLNRALSLGTIPSLARADSGYLFSGSRPASQSSQSKESPTSGHFGNSALRGLLAVSLTLNAIFTSAYVYRSLR